MTEQADQNAARYLLGGMPDGERDAFEVRMLAEPELSELVAATEADLLDAYARGELREEERALVKRHLLATDAQRARLDSSRELQIRLQPRSARSRRLWWALAAAAVIAAIAILSVMQQRPQAPARDAAPAVAGAPAPARTTTAKLPPAPASAPGKRRPVVVTLVLASAMTRSEGASATVKLPPEAQTLRIVIGLAPGDDEFESYRAVVQTVGGRVVGQRDGVAATDGGLHIELPATAFRAGDYEVLVEAAGSSGREPLGAWSFAVAR